MQQLPLQVFYRGLEWIRFPQMRHHAKKKRSIYLALQTFSLMKLNNSRVLPRTTDSHLCDVLHAATARLTPELTATLQSITVPIRSDTGE